MAKRFEGKTALVTGGSRGIGKAIVENLLQEGVKVYAVGKSQENLDKPGRPGAVVNISSVGGMRSCARVMPYCVSKAMMDMLTKVTALELGPHKIRVNSVNPIGVHTDMTNHIFENEKFQRMFISKHPLGKFCTSEDVVKATMFLLSNDSAMIKGSCLVVDGGYVLH